MEREREGNMSKKRELTEYGKMVKHRLIEMNMTQVELAGQVQTSKQYLGKILFGERSGQTYVPHINMILGIAVEPY